MCLFQKPLGEKRFFLEQPKLIDFENICKQYVFILCCCTLSPPSDILHSVERMNCCESIFLFFCNFCVCPVSTVHICKIRCFVLDMQSTTIWVQSLIRWVTHRTYVCSENGDDSEMETRSTPRSECGYRLCLCRLAAVTPRQIIPCKFLPGGGWGGRYGGGR